MVMISLSFAVASLAGLAVAQFPAEPQGITTLQSKLQAGVTISYKENNICETTPGVKSFSGYIHLPSSALDGIGDYNISTFFWYFESRNDPAHAPLSIYLAGGPGESSTYAAASSESGPCYVNPDGKSTSINLWSFNNHVNMLYVDQPSFAGFSYDTLVNGTFDLETNTVTPTDFSNGLPQTNETFYVGTFASQNPNATVNNTVAAAKAFWRFSRIWLKEFPEYKTSSKKISIWTNSYGGYWGPAFTSRLSTEISASNGKYKFTLDTLGITNGCIDQLYHSPSYPQYAYNNTYNFQAIPHDTFVQASRNFSMSGGCKDLIQQCRALGKEGDPDNTGNNATVNAACDRATDYCVAYVAGAYDVYSNRSDFDLAITQPEPCPYYISVFTFFNQPWVQQALGVPLNFTYDSNVITSNFGLATPGIGTGDSFRQSIEALEDVLQKDIRVAMIYGDRDYRCNWLGAEATSLAANYPHAAAFARAGYEPLNINGTFHHGRVRQHGKFSFTRVFEAGHAVSAYKPEVVYRIFQRAMFDRDIPTGAKNIKAEKYSSKGPKSSFGIKNQLPLTGSVDGCVVEGQVFHGTT